MPPLNWAVGLEGKLAVVTGAGRRRGIGASIARELARCGAAVAVVGNAASSRRKPRDEEASGWRGPDSLAEELGGKSFGLLCDVSSEDSVGQCFRSVEKQAGVPDIVVHCAGSPRPMKKHIEDTTAEEWKRAIDTNVNGTFFIARAAVAAMRRRGRGDAIVLVSSISSTLCQPGTGPYAAGKGAVDVIARVLANEVSDIGIRVNAVRPGVVTTARHDDLLDSPAGLGPGTSLSPLGRAGTPEEVAFLVTFLCSDLGSWITGQSFNIDGGKSSHFGDAFG